MFDSSNPGEVFSRPNESARIHDLEHFTLWTNTPNRPGYRSRLSFGERNGAPRITFFPNVENAPVAIGIGMPPNEFEFFLQKWEMVVKGANGVADKIENMGAGANSERGKGVKKEDLTVKNITHFGKSQDGLCWIAVEQPGVEKVRFTISPSIWHRFYNAEGVQMTEAECSARYTLGMISNLRTALAPYIARLRPLSEKAAARSNGAGGTAQTGDYKPSSISTFDDVQY